MYFIELNITSYERIGIKRMVVKWNQMNQFKYPISRYHFLINGNKSSSYLDKDSLETCLFIF